MVAAILRFLLASPAFVAGVLAWSMTMPAMATEPLQVVTVAIPRHFPPLYQVDQVDKPKGFAIDVLEAVAARSNLHINYHIAENFADAMELVSKGRADLIPNLGINDERSSKFDYTDPVDVFPIALFVRSEDDSIHNVNDLSGRFVVMLTGNVAHDLLRGQRSVHMIHHTNVENAFFDLLRGEADAFIAPVPLVLSLARQARVEDRIRQVGRPLIEIKRAMAVHKGNIELLARLNRTINPFVHSSEYRDIYQRWHSPPAPYWTLQRVLWWAASLLLLIFLGMGFWRYIVVSRLNRQLEQQLDELRRFQKLTVGRELQMKKLRDEIEQLKTQRYSSRPESNGDAP